MPPRISRILMRPMRADLTSMPDEILWQVGMRASPKGPLDHGMVSVTLTLSPNLFLVRAMI